MDKVLGTNVWLIEDDEHTAGVPVWLRLVDQDRTWTNDANLALQFVRREDARNYVRTHGTDGVFCILTEHVFVE